MNCHVSDKSNIIFYAEAIIFIHTGDENFKIASSKRNQNFTLKIIDFN